MSNYERLTDLPIGLGMALVETKDAMEYFSSLSNDEKEQIVKHAHTIKSRDEMYKYVQSFANKNSFMS